MAIAARKRFNISKKSVKNGIYSCPPLEGGSKSLISRRGTRAKRALNIVGIDKQNTGLIHVTNLFPYFLNPLFPLPKRPHAQNPCPIRLSARGGGAKSAPHNTFRRTKSALTLRTNAKAQQPPTGHPELVSGSPTKFNTS